MACRKTYSQVYSLLQWCVFPECNVISALNTIPKWYWAKIVFLGLGVPFTKHFQLYTCAFMYNTASQCYGMLFLHPRTCHQGSARCISMCVEVLWCAKTASFLTSVIGCTNVFPKVNRSSHDKSYCNVHLKVHNTIKVWRTIEQNNREHTASFLALVYWLLTWILGFH